MAFNVLVAEPSNEDWSSIATGIRRHHPDASILRVLDGEQAARFLFERGLFTDEPETPNLVVLSAALSAVALEAIIDQLKKNSRTRLTQIIVVQRSPDAGDGQPIIHSQPLFLTVGPGSLEPHIAKAMQTLRAIG